MFDEVTTVRGRAPGDDYFRRQQETTDQRGQDGEPVVNPLDGEKGRNLHTKLLSWFFMEREKQSVNRMEMAMDADFYDNLQWDPQDSQDLRDRGQMPLVYNEVAPMVDWIIGTERRTRVDWAVLPRTEDDVQAADIKTKVMKYVSDINHSSFARSRAFGDAVKAGLGWVDTGARDDPTQDVLYDKYQDWRQVLYDSASQELDLSDARYIFRWRWVDEDVAVAMYPEREMQIRRAVEKTNHNRDISWEEENWQNQNTLQSRQSGQLYASGTGVAINTKRRQVKLIEAQYRMPVTTKVITSGPLKGAVVHPGDTALQQAHGNLGGSIMDKVIMRTHVSVFTEGDMICADQSIYRHNRFSLTPIWCYRRSRDRMPYGVIRRVRDIQQDLNKRASKALFMLNTNQVIADEGAVEDWDKLRDEVDRPDGMIVKRPGKEIIIRRDTDAATGQLQMMTMDAQSIQKSAGVSQENMGRQTNAVSGEAIKARQTQGSVVTTEPFDNLRYATQIHGENLLSLCEQFITEEKVIRLTGAKGAIDWVYVNKPEQQPDGSVRYINDITASMADFVVSEQDYSGTLRQVMFESLNQMATRLPPEVSLRVLTIAMEFSDLPNKDEIADQIRKLTGDRDPNKEPTPEEQQQAAEQAQAQAEALQMQRETAMAALDEARAKVREINAKAAKLEAEAAAAGQEGALPPGMQSAINQVQAQAAEQIDKLSGELAKAQSDLANRTLALNKEADTKVALAHIDRETRVQVAEISQVSDAKIKGFENRIDQLSQIISDMAADTKKRQSEHESTLAKVEQGQEKAIAKLEQTIEKQAAQTEKAIEKVIAIAEPKEKPAEPAAPVAPPPPPAPPAPPQPIVVNVTVDGQGEVTKEIHFEKDAEGNVTGGKVIQRPKKKE